MREIHHIDGDRFNNSPDNLMVVDMPKPRLTARTEFHRVMAERRCWTPGSADWEYRSRAARRLYWLMRGVPAACWPQ